VARTPEPPRSSGPLLRGSVRLRVTLAAAGLFAVALTIASFALVRSVHDSLTNEIQQTNNEQLDAVARQIRAGTDPADVQIPNGDTVGQPNLRALGPRGERLALPTDGVGPAIPRDQARIRTRRTIETAQGTVTLVAERSLAQVDDTVSNVTNALLVGVPLLFALVAGLTWWIAGRALRPVEAIRAEAAAITGSTLHRRVPEPASADEVGRLARTMNSMLDRLEETSLRQRRFVSDASHELRSPVAAIRAQVEVAMRRGDAADWPEVARRVLDEDERLEQAVTELLELARAEEGAAIDQVEVDLDEVVLEEATRVRRVPVDTSGVSAGRVLGSEAQLARVVRNLLDNACRHAASKVAVTLGTRDGSVWLAVDDDGPGIPVEDRARVFDRFTRLDEGRARDVGGVGLGLSMVHAIVERHGGVVSADAAPLGGARFVVRLPAG
jgi:signal transduction histidine kinase